MIELILVILNVEISQLRRHVFYLLLQDSVLIVEDQFFSIFHAQQVESLDFLECERQYFHEVTVLLMP